MSDWSPERVEERLAEAALVLKRLPEPRRHGHFNTWPDLVRTRCELAAMQSEPMRARPIPAAISRMEETLSWTVGLEPIDGQIVWLRAYGTPWKIICRTVGLQRSAAHRHWLYALHVIASRLNQRPVPAGRSMRSVIEVGGQA